MDAPSVLGATFAKVNPLHVVASVAPERFAPVMTTGTLVPLPPLPGDKPEIVGGVFAVTANKNVVVNPWAASVTVAEPRAAVGLTLAVAVTVVSFVEVMLLNVSPCQVVESAEPHKLLPVIVRLTLEFRLAAAGLTEEMTGAGAALTTIDALTGTH